MHVGPVYPGGQEHILGATHTPPLWHPPEHIAVNIYIWN